MALPVDNVDVEARLRAARIIHEKFRKVLDDIMRGKPPKLVIPKRTLGNTIFDPERGILVLGEEHLEREFLDLGESRRFMQTLLMASIIYQSLVENEYPTIRDLYYRGKHTIVYRDLRGRIREENTWDEQAESDAVIRDVEVYTGMLREDMLILSKEKGKVVGNMRIRSGGDVIDLSRLGHGAYAIESTPDLIEFLDVDAEFVLVVEKDAVFQQLHRVGFWRKYRSLLVTGAGQPDRATRRFVRRLHDELGLPVYILTDSIPADEVVVVRDTITGAVHVGPVEELLGPLFTPGLDEERITPPIEVPSWNPSTGRIEWTPVGYAYRHYVDTELLEIETQGRGTVRVTTGHSLFVFRDGSIQVIPASEIKPGDYILVAEKLPEFSALLSELNIANLLQGAAAMFGSNVFVKEAKKSIPSKIEIDEDLGWLFGLYTAEGSTAYDRYINISLNKEEIDKLEKFKKIMKEKFNIEPVFNKADRPEYRVRYGSRTLHIFMRNIGLGRKTREKVLPHEILNSPKNVKISYIKGLIGGDGSLDKYGDVIFSTRSKILSKQLVTLLLSLGVNPTVVENRDDIIIRIAKSPTRTPPEIYKYLTGIKPELKTKGLPTEPTYKIPINSELKRLLIRLANRGKISYKPVQNGISKMKLTVVKTHVGRHLPSDYNKILESDLTLVKVKNVRKTRYRGYVYDFAVPGTNSFIGSYGILYHNSDPYGWYIFSVFKVGSIQLSYESERLATPGARFLGVSMTDIFGWRGKRAYLSERERRSFIIRAKDVDVRRAKELMRYAWFRSPKWRRELRIFLERKAKLEIEALASKGLRFLAFQYIPEKIETGDWIE